MKLVIKTILLQVFLLQLFYQTGMGQNAPVTTLSTVTNVVGGQQVTINVSVTNFTNIGSISLSLNYDYSKLHFVSGTINTLLSDAGNYAIGDNDIGNGMHRLITGWYGFDTSLPDQTVILTYVFTFLSGSSLLEWFDNGSSCSYTDYAGFFLNDLPYSTYYKNGKVCGLLSDPGLITGSDSVCQNATSVSYRIDPVVNAKTYVWSTPAGSIIRSGANTNSVIIDYLGTPGAGDISVYAANDCGNSLTSTLRVSVFAPPAISAGNDTTIITGSFAQLHGAATGSGKFIFHWSPDTLVTKSDILMPSSVRLFAAAVFRLTVTDQVSNCITWDEMSVTVKDIINGINRSEVPGDPDNAAGTGFTLFPNPAKDRVTLRNLTTTSGIIKISVFNSGGIRVKTIEADSSPGNTDHLIEIEDLPPGIYIINILSDRKSISKRLVVR